MTEIAGLKQPDPQPHPAPTDDSRRLLWSLGAAQLGLSIAFGAVPSVLLALQVERAVGDDDKAVVLAIITTIGALAAMITQPLVGALSDRTRHRRGRRAPWMLRGVLIALPLLALMGLTDSMILLGVLFTLTEAAFAMAQGPLVAVLPDRVPHQARGRFSAVTGLGVMIGTITGQGVAALFSDHLSLAYIVVGCIPVAFMLVLVRTSPDVDTTAAPHQKPAFKEILAGYWLSPRTYPDFAWAFLSRLLTYTGFFMVYGYTLYILDDFVGLGDEAVDKVPLVLLVAGVGICASTVPAGILSDRLGRRKIFVLISSAGIGIAFIVPLLVDGLTGIFVMFAIAGVAFGFYTAVDQALITEVLPREASYGQDIGVVNMASALPQVLAPAFAGAVVVAADYGALFPAGAVFTILGGLAILPIRSVR
jgi:MFS family permease